MDSVKRTSSVLANGHFIIQKGSDCGKLIPQITIPPNNALFPVELVGSSRNVIFSAFSVRMNGLPAACTSTWPPLPHLTCGDPVSMPLTFTVTNIARSVFVGASFADIVGGVIQTLVRMATDAIVFVGAGSPMVKEAAKMFCGVIGTGLASAAQHALDPRYPIDVQTKLKAFGLEFTAGVTCGSTDTTNNPSSVTVGVAKKFEAGAGMVGGKASTSATYTWNSGNDPSKEGLAATQSVSAGSVAGGGKSTVTEEVHPNAPGGTQGGMSTSLKGSVAGGAGTGSAGTAYNPFAAPGQQTTTSASASNNTGWGQSL